MNLENINTEDTISGKFNFFSYSVLTLLKMCVYLYIVKLHPGMYGDSEIKKGELGQL